MTGHWSKPIDYSDETMEQARSQLDTFRNYFVGLEYEPEAIGEDELDAVLDDDFNTPEALALFHDWRTRGDWVSLRSGLQLFGLESLAEPEVAPTELMRLAKERRDARRRNDFAEADRLRDEIAAAGW